MSVCWHVQAHAAGEENHKCLLQVGRIEAEGDDITDWHRRHSTVSEQHVGAPASPPCPPEREAVSAPFNGANRIKSSSCGSQPAPALPSQPRQRAVIAGPQHGGQNCAAALVQFRRTSNKTGWSVTRSSPPHQQVRHPTVSEQHVGATASPPFPPEREAASAPSLLNHHVGSTSKSEQVCF